MFTLNQLLVRALRKHWQAACFERVPGTRTTGSTHCNKAGPIPDTYHGTRNPLANQILKFRVRVKGGFRVEQSRNDRNEIFRVGR